MKLLPRILVSLAALLLLLAWIPWHELVDAFGRLPSTVWIGALAGFLAGHVLGIFKWRAMLSVEAMDTPVREAGRSYAAGLFSNLFLPGVVGGDVVRAGIVLRGARRSEPVVVAAAADRLVDFVALASLVGTGGLLAPTATGAAVVASTPFVGGVRSRVRRFLARSLVSGRRLARRPATLLTVLALALAIQGGFVLLNAWIGRSMEIAVPLAAWFVAWPLAKVVAALPISLAGLGVRDAAFASILAWYGAPLAEGVACSLVWEAVVVSGGLLAGASWFAQERWPRTGAGS